MVNHDWFIIRQDQNLNGYYNRCPSCDPECMLQSPIPTRGSTSFHPYSFNPLSFNPDFFTPLSFNPISFHPSIISSRHLEVDIKGIFCHYKVDNLIQRSVVIVSYQVPRAAEAWPWPAKHGQMIILLI